MKQTRIIAGRQEGRAARASLLFAAGALLVGAPTAVFAIPDESLSRGAVAQIVPFTPANVDPAVARSLAAKIAARGQTLRFTPAGSAPGKNRTVTVAIRVAPEQARAISVRSAIAAAKGEAGAGPSIATLAKSRYNLGISRGYETFAKPAVPSLNLKPIEMPDLASFRPREGVKETPGRLQPRLALESGTITGRSPRTLEGAGEQAVDLGAGYRLSKNLNVTAGVRLSQERDRLAPLTDAVRDDQAVYVGTQFRF
ncbi:hypothetical protein A6F68_00348 [Tsuneonella dongtanensis]|uniref:Porin domain-containing protein n=1 Tax=Tsuneonella dongtanensis TaxID=692370 RepID=A0A1B2A9M1_9SPHN|nr:hypothetical protein [Tsuneonella dongtanensis]ANY18883.1 hypothetical protein A6F68_00348 [Tsuneonella dongtanensis]